MMCLRGTDPADETPTVVETKYGTLEPFQERNKNEKQSNFKLTR